MKKILSFVILASLALSSCSTAPKKKAADIMLLPQPPEGIQGYNYTNLNLKDLLEKIRRFNAKLQRADLSRGLDAATMNEFYEIDRQYKAFKALEFNKNTAEFALKPRSQTTFKFNSTYCLDPGKASPHAREPYVLQKQIPDIPLYEELAIYSNLNTNTARSFKQSLIWNLKNEVIFERLPVNQRVYLIKMDPKSLLKVNNYFKREIQRKVAKLAKSKVPGYDKVSKTLNIVKGKVYTYNQHEQRVRSMVSRYKISDSTNPIPANGYDVSTFTTPSGYSSAVITFLNMSDAVIYISCASHFLSLRRDVQPLGFDFPLIFFDIEIYGADIEKEYEILSKYMQAN